MDKGHIAGAAQQTWSALHRRRAPSDHAGPGRRAHGDAATHFAVLIVLVISLGACASLQPGANFPKSVSVALIHPEETRLGGSHVRVRPLRRSSCPAGGMTSTVGELCRGQLGSSQGMPGRRFSIGNPRGIPTAAAR